MLCTFLLSRNMVITYSNSYNNYNILKFNRDPNTYVIIVRYRMTAVRTPNHLLLYDSRQDTVTYCTSQYGLGCWLEA